jgi:hypothetical protein
MFILEFCVVRSEYQTPNVTAHVISVETQIVTMRHLFHNTSQIVGVALVMGVANF